MTGVIVQVAAAGLRVLGKSAAQGSGHPVAEPPGQAGQQLLVGKINPEGHAGGVVLSVITAGKVVGGQQAGFRVQRVSAPVVLVTAAALRISATIWSERSPLVGKTICR